MSTAGDEVETTDVQHRKKLMITLNTHTRTHTHTHTHCSKRLKSGAGKLDHSIEEMKGRGEKTWSQCKQISQMMSLVNQMLLMNGLRGKERGREGRQGGGREVRTWRKQGRKKEREKEGRDNTVKDRNIELIMK